MSIESIFNFIDSKGFINNNEISFNNYFKGNIDDYNTDIIDIIKKKYGTDALFSTESSIIIKKDEYRILIYYKKENDELYWTVNVL